VVPDAYADERFMPDVDARGTFRTTSVLCVPILRDEEVLGVIEVLNKEPAGVFASEDLAMVTAVAAQATTALQHARLYHEARALHLRTMRGLATVLADRSPYMRGHLQRVRDYALRIAAALKVGAGERELLADAAMLHDIGLIAVREEVVNKQGILSPEERAEVERHPLVGARLVESARELSPCAPIIRHHHERWDGTGYPDRLRGDHIPLAARVLAVAEAFDSMTSAQPYRPYPLPSQKAVQELEQGAGTQFDPSIVSCFVSCVVQPGVTNGVLAVREE